MTRPDAVRLRPAVPVVIALAIAIALFDATLRLAPLGGLSSIEVGNAFVATVVLVWALVMAWTHRRSGPLRRAWGCAALGALLVVAEDHIEAAIGSTPPTFADVATSAPLWIAAAYLFFAVGRRYAMRRHVENAMRAALVTFALATALSLVLASGLAGHAHRPLVTLQEGLEFATTGLFVLGLVLARFAPLKSYAFAPEEIGRRARRLFSDFDLETRRRYPTPYPALAIAGPRHLLTVAMIAWFAPGAARAAARAGGRSVPRQIWDMLRLGFGEDVDAKSYYVHDLYRHDVRAAGMTMTRVETKNGLVKAMQNLRAGRPGPRDMNDKLAFWRSCEENGVPSAPILASVEGGTFAPFVDRSRFDRDLFVKDRSGRGGRFTLNFERIAPFFYRDDEGGELGFDEVVARLEAHAADRRLIVQPKLANHPAIASLADKALIVFRVMTCLDQRGEPHVTHGVLRLLRRFEPAWPRTADSDWGCTVDVDTGVFGMMTGDAPETATRWFSDHPVTGERVEGRRLEGWNEIAEVALAAHRVFQTRILVGWDMAWTPDGPCILEGNNNPDFSYFQRVSRTPVGRSRLAPLLNAHFDELTAKLIQEAEAR